MIGDAIRRLCDAYAAEYLEGSSPVPYEFIPQLGRELKKRVDSITVQVLAQAKELPSSQLPFALYGAVVKLRQNALTDARRIIESLGDEMAGRIQAFQDEFSGRDTPTLSASTLTQFMKETFPDTPVVLAALKGSSR